jgi:hypothetical protein
MLPSSKLIDLSQEEKSKYSIDSNLYSSRGEFGVSRINEFNKYIERGRGGKVEGSAYLANVNKVIGNADIQALKRSNAKVFVSAIEAGLKPGQKPTNLTATESHPSTLRYPADKQSFLHSKYYIVESAGGDRSVRLDTSALGTVSALGVTAGPMGLGQTNLFYQTSNSQIVNEVQNVHNAISNGGVASSGQFIKVNKDIVSSLNKDVSRAKGDILIHSAGLGFGDGLGEESKNINRFYDMLSDRASSGTNRVFFSTSNPNRRSNRKVLDKLRGSGALIGKNKYSPGSNLPAGWIKGGSEHYNLFVLEDVGDEGDVVYLSTRRTTGSPTDEIALRLTSSFDPEAVKFFKSFNFSRFDFDIDSYVSTKKRNSRGYNNNQLTPFFNSNMAQYIIPSRHGVSHFYEMALFNVARRNAGHEAMNIIDQRGYATAAYVIKQASQYEGSMASTVPRFVVDYDREMNTPGLGYYINQWGIQNGFGRIYKDEYGALPSFAGAIGAVLDRSLGYYVGEMHVTDFLNQREDLNMGASYETMTASAGKGTLENTFAFGTNFVMTSATAVLSYFTFGLPAGYAASETFKYSMQSMLDIALDQTENAAKFDFVRKSYVANVLGLEFLTEEYAGEGSVTRGKKIHEKLMAIAQGDKELRIQDFYSTRMHTIPGYNNSLYRRRAGFIFDTIVDPFIEEVVSPYQASVNNKNWMRLRSSINKYSKALYDPIYLQYETSPDVEGKWVLKNIGYERAENIAQALDEVLIHLPANPLKWGFFGKTNNTTVDFTTLGEIFSFKDMVSTFERMYFNTGFHSIVGRSEIVDNAGGLRTAKGKLQTIFNIPGQIVKSGMQRFRESVVTLHGPLKEYKKLRSLQSDMIQKGLLTWNGESMTRQFNFTDEKEFHQFLDGVMEYQSQISPNLKMNVSPHELEILQGRQNTMKSKAAAYFKEQQTKVGQIRKLTGKVSVDPILNNKGKIGVFVFGALAAGLALDDLFNSYGGASIWNQMVVSLHHREVTAVEFSTNRILPTHGGTAAVLSLGYAGFAFASGYGLASYMQGVEFERYQVAGADKAIKDSILSWAHSKSNYKIGGEVLANFLEEQLTHGIMTPKGNFLRNFLMSSVAILAARDLARNAAVGALNLIRNIPFIGEQLLGKGSISPNANLILASRLGSFRGAVLTKMEKNLPTSELERMAAYRAGIMLKNMPVATSNKTGQFTSVLAQQGPLPVFQFFLTQTTKGRMESPSGQVLAKGKVFWSFGMQTAPILGGNAAFSSPIALDYDRETKNPTGFSVVYNDDKTNVLNYFNGVAAFGMGAMMTAGAMLAVLDGMGGLAKMFNSEGLLTQDLAQASKTVRTIAKTFDKAVDFFTLTPSHGLNAATNLLKSDTQFYNELLEDFSKRTSGQIPKKLPKTIRGFRAISAAFIYGYAARFTADIFTDDPNIINATTFAGAVGGAVLTFNEQEIYTRINPALKPIKKVWHSLDTNILSKATRSKFFLPVMFAAAAFLATDSNFGISKGMDVDADLQPDPLKRATTIGIYAGLGAVATIAFSDIGKDAVETLRAYEKFSSHAAKYRSNPISYTYSLYASWKKHQLAKDVKTYRDQVQLYLHHVSPQEAAGELAESVAGMNQMDRALHNINESAKVDVEEIIGDRNLKQSYEKIWQTDEFAKFSKGKRNVMGIRRGVRVLSGLAGVAIMTTVVASAIGGVLRETTDSQEAMDTFYDSLDNFGGKGAVNSVSEGIGNAIRLITGRDRSAAFSPANGEFLQRIVTDHNGRKISMRGKKLIKFTDARANNIANIVKDLTAPYIIDPQEPYQSLLPFLGVTFRKGDKGLRLNFYTQFQSANQDVSSAIYHMSQSYMFNMAMQNNSQLRAIIEMSMQKIDKDILYTEKTQFVKMQKVALAIYTSTAQLDSLSPKNRRKFTMLTTEAVQGLITSDSLISMSIRERNRRLTELANQPLESIVSRMSDFNNPSQLMSTGNTVDMDNIFASAEANMSPEDKLLLMGNDNYSQVANDFFFHVMNPLGKLAYQTFGFSWDNKKKAVQSNKLSIDSASEFLEYDSIFLDVNSFEKGSAIGAIFRPVDEMLNAVSFGFKPFKWGIYFAAASVAAFTTLGLAGGMLLKVEKPAILDAVNVTQNMFGEIAEDETLRGFSVERRLTAGNGVAMDSRTYQVRRGNALYELKVPEGINPDDFRQTYINALSDIQVRVQQTTDALVQDIFGVLEANPILSGWQNQQQAELVANLKSSYQPMIDRYVDDLFGSEMLSRNLGDYAPELDGFTFGSVSSSGMDNLEAVENMKAGFKNKLRDYLEEVLDQEIAGQGIFNDSNLRKNLLSRYRNLSGTEEAFKYLGFNVLDRMKFIFLGLRQNLLVLENQDYSGYTLRMEKQIDKWVKEADSRTIASFFRRTKSRNPILSPSISVSSGGALPDDMIQGINRQPAYSKFAVLGKGFSFAVNMLGAFEAFDIYGSYSSLSAAQDNPDATSGDEMFLAQHAGGVTTNSLFGIGLGLTSAKLLKMLPRLMGKAKGKAGLIIGGIVLGAVLLTAGWKNVKEVFYKVHHSYPLQKTYEVLGKLYEGTATLIGKGVLGIGQFLENTTGIKRSVATNIIGGALGAVTLLMAASAFAPVLASGGAFVAATAIGGTIGGLLSAIPGYNKTVGLLSRQALNNISRIPIIGGFLATPATDLFNWKSNQFHDPNSPIVAATPQQAIQNDYRNYLLAAKDYTGNQTKSLLTNSTIYGQRSGYKQTEPQMQALSLRPTNLVNPLIDRELAIRAQHYNQSVIGVAMWYKQISTAQNSAELKKYQEVLAKAEPQIKQQLDKTKSMEQAEVQNLNKAIAQFKKGSPLNHSQEHNVVANILESTSSIVNKKSERVRTTVIVDNQAVINQALEENTNYLRYNTNSLVVASTQIKKTKTDNNEISLSQSVGDSNDLIMSVVGDYINPLKVEHPEFS